jgi:flavin-dependent dehydrogenase
MGSYLEPTETDVLNAQNKDPTVSNSDVVVVGAGIHSLIYAIHATLRAPPSKQLPTITVLEKAALPSYKIGESTLTVFGLWLKTIGINSPLLWRLFGPKDGLAFYYLNAIDHNPDEYTSFCANGPPGDFVPTLQIERKISELLLTLYAQRLGVKVLHGHAVDIDATLLSSQGNTVQVKAVSTGKQSSINTELVVDATGRFRRFASKQARIKRFEGWNCDAFWAYFEETKDESEIPLEHYESCNTNHICLAEG